MTQLARADDKAASSYERLLAEIRNTGQVLEQRLDLFGQRIEQRGDLTDQRLARNLARLGFWLAGVMIGTAAAMAGLAAAGAF